MSLTEIQRRLFLKLIKTHFQRFKDILSYNIKLRMGDTQINYSFLDEHCGDFLKSASLQNIKETLDLLDNYYYNENPLVSDATYDIISEFYYNRTGEEKSSKIGHNTKGLKVKLPVHLGSMDKVKPGQSALNTFLSKYTNNKGVSSKLDGHSMLIGKQNGSLVAYTRGDGTKGKDISHILTLIKTSKGIPLSVIIGNLDNNTYIRGELLISKSNWSKNTAMGSNARNVIGKITNKKQPDLQAANIADFLGYEYISDKQLSISAQFNLIKQLGIDTPIFRVLTPSQCTAKNLPKLLDAYKKASKYEIDGIIVQDDIYHPRNTSKNPKYAKAFKMEKYNESAIVQIDKIYWGKTKSGTLKPTIIIPPTLLKDVEIKRVYGYNASYIKQHKLGAGSTIEFIRSGDVIPKVKSVIHSVFDEKTDFPSVNYHWNENKVDIVLDNCENDDEVKIRQLESFISKMGIEFFKIGTIRKMYKIGLTEISQVILMNDTSLLLKAEGIKAKSANKILYSIKEKMQNTTVSQFAGSLPCFKALGRKRMKLITDVYPNFYEIPKQELYTKIVNLKTFSDITATHVIEGIDKFLDYLEIYKSMYSFNSKQEILNLVSNKFNGKIYCFSGIRNKKVSQYITENGGIVENGIRSSVTDIIVKDISSTSKKIEKAKSRGINIIDFNSFIGKHSIQI